jgi:pimeloyl-ACP methyl ester carboxylesterase
MESSIRVHVRLWAGTASLLLLAGCLHAATRRTRWLSPCAIEGVEGVALCGTLEVLENGAAPQGRKIPLRVVVLKATGAAPVADPVYLLTGGPGQAATERIAAFAREHTRTRVQRDLVLVDQRGTGGSNPLRCEVPQEDDADEVLRQRARACLERNAASADVRFYTTPQAADDLEAVRIALGHERINLDGGSYGTRLALVYLRSHSERVRSVVLRGVSPTDFRNPLPFSQAGQAALDALLEACRADAKCGSAFPELGAKFQQVLDTLQRAPVSVELKPETGPTKTVRISRERFAQLVHLVLFITPLARQLPFLIHRASQGHFDEFAALAVAFEDAIAAQIYWGLQLAVVCPEDLARITPEDVARETPGTFLGDSLIRSYQIMCAEWPRATMPADYWQPVQASVPALLFSGDRDPSTPPHFGQDVADHLPLSRHLVLPGATHINPSGCVDKVVSEFIAAGTVQGLDTACLQEPFRWDFFVPEPKP